MKPCLLFTVLSLALALFQPSQVAAQGSSEAFMVQARGAVGASLSDLLPSNEAGAAAVLDALVPTLGLTAAPPLVAGTVNNAYLVQSGAGNTADIIQRLGLGNVVVLLQTGNGNALTLLQEGSSNVYSAALTGDNNLLTADQIGDGNTYTLDFVGSDLNHSVLQLGNENEAVQVGTSSTRPADIVQQGDGLRVLVEHN